MPVERQSQHRRLRALEAAVEQVTGENARLRAALNEQLLYSQELEAALARHETPEGDTEAAAADKPAQPDTPMPNRRQRKAAVKSATKRSNGGIGADA